MQSTTASTANRSKLSATPPDALKNTAETSPQNTAETSPHFAMPGFEMPKFEMPAGFHELTEKNVAQAKKNYEKIQEATEEMTSVLEKTYSTAAKGVTDYNRKLIDIAQANASAALEFACELIAMKSLPAMVELSAAQARKQFDLVSGQNRELWALAQKITTETGEPIKESVTHVFNKISRSQGLASDHRND